eukprot:6470847-Amphidinium_carterae.2
MGQSVGTRMPNMVTVHTVIIWLDHSIIAWSQSDTHWDSNEFSAITMLNTHSMSSTSVIGANRTIFHGLDASANVNSRQQQWQWHGLAVDKPSDNHALFGDNDSGEGGEVVHNPLDNEYHAFDNDFVLTSLHNATLPKLSNVRC